MASVDITPNSPIGTFVASDNNSSVSFGVKTDNLTGYNLTLSARPGDTSGQLINASYNEELDTISSAANENTFATGDTSTYVNKWGILPSKLNSSDNTDYLPAPIDTTGFTMDTTNSANPTTANNYTIGIGARVDYTKPTGTYTNTYVIQAVTRAMTYEITYSNGGLSDVSGAVPATESNTAAISSITLATPSLTRSTYTFKGWCDGAINTTVEYDATNKMYNNPGTICNGTLYTTSTPYKFAGKTISPDNNNQVTLIAVWEPTTVAQAYASTSGSVTYTTTSTTYYPAGTYYTLQSMSATTCSKITPNQYGIVVDNRDGNTYKIGKLEDNRCWMVDNLALDLGSTSVLNSITTSNTHIDAASLTSLKSGNRSAGDRYATAGVTSSWTTTDSIVKPMIKKDSVNCSTTVSTTCNPSDSGPYNYTMVPPNSNDYGVGSNKFGIFYNYCAASGGNYCYTAPNYNANGAMYDICPASWRLPTGDTSGETEYLFNQIQANYTGDTDTTFTTATEPLSFQYKLSTPLSGFLATGYGRYVGVVGYTWTSSYYSDGSTSYNYMIHINVGRTGVYPSAGGTRNVGMPIRCIAQN